MPAANAEAMSLHLTAIGRKVVAGSHAALVLDGAGTILLPRSRSPKTSPLCVCYPMLLNSIRSKTSGNICAATNSPSPSSTTTTTSLIKPATHGTSLNKIQCASRQSPPEHGRLSIIRAVGIRLLLLKMHDCSRGMMGSRDRQCARTRSQKNALQRIPQTARSPGNSNPKRLLGFSEYPEHHSSRNG
jgi:hypothetical protein